MHEDTLDPASRVARNRARMTGRWSADLHIVDTVDGELHVATCSGGEVARHIAELHNRTLGDGQDPPAFPENEQALHQMWLAEATGQVPGQERQDGQHEIMTVGDKSNLHVAYVASGRVARYLVTLHNDRVKAGRAYLAGDVEDRNDEAADAGPYPNTAAFLASLNDPRMARERRAQPRGDGLDSLRYALRAYGSGMPRQRSTSALGQALRHERVPEYAARLVDVVEEEILRRVTAIQDREPARITIAESPEAMVWALRKLGYIVIETGQPHPASGADLGLASTRELLEELRVRGEVGRAARLEVAASDLLGRGDGPGLSEGTLDYRTVTE